MSSYPKDEVEKSFEMMKSLLLSGFIETEDKKKREFFLYIDPLFIFSFLSLNYSPFAFQENKQFLFKLAFSHKLATL